MEVRLPRLGEGADSGTVSTIFVKEGDEVRKDQPVLELESEKAVASIPSPADGIITKIHVKEGDEIKVGQLILSLSGNGTSGESPATRQPGIAGQKPVEETEVPPESPADSGVQDEAAIIVTEPSEESEVPPSRFAPPASPSVRRIARELGIDLRRVKGSERGGRITIADVRRYIQRLQQMASGPAARQPERARPLRVPPEAVDYAKWGPVKREKLSTLRRTIGEKMVESWTTIPHVTQFDEADATEMARLQKKYSAAYKKKGAHLTLTTFVVHAVVETLKKFPRFNASLDESTGELVLKQYYNIGIAVDTEQGLIVPVIRDADKKGMLELSLELQSVAARTRERKITFDDMQGGTFTISNQGGIGSAQFTPVIYAPQVAILGLGRGTIRAVVRHGRVAQRMVLPVSLSYDHRIVDGADAARFMVEFVGVLERMNEAAVKL